MENDVEKQELVKETKRSIILDVIFGAMWIMMGCWELFLENNLKVMILMVSMAVVSNCLVAFSVSRKFKKIKVNNS